MNAFPASRRAVVVTLGLVVATACARPPIALAGDKAAGPTTAELLGRIEALEKALAEVKREAACPCAAAPAEVAPAAANDGGAPDASSGDTARRPALRAVRITPSPSSGAVEAAAVPSEAPAKPASPTVGYADGFFVASADGAYRLRVGGYLQADGRFFADDGDGTDQFTIRRARLDLRATLARRFTLRFTPDFAGSRVTIQDAYLDTDFAPWLQARAGKFKVPFGIERLQSSTNIPFVERALTDNLVPNRDIGLRVSGDWNGGTLEYALALMNGVPDGSSGDGDVNDSFDVVARVFAKPYATSMYSPLRGAAFGMAATWGREQGSTSSTQLSSYVTAGRSTFFGYRTDAPSAVADGDHYRLSPQASWYEGSLGLLGEYVLSSQQVARGAERGWVANDSWQVRASYVLTGEKASMQGVVPDAPFDFGGGHWGAWELAMRWSALVVDGEAFAKSFADATASARRADAIAAAVNWYLTRNVTLYLHYEHTMFDGGRAGGDRGDEDVFLTRMQLAF